MKAHCHHHHVCAGLLLGGLFTLALSVSLRAQTPAPAPAIPATPAATAPAQPAGISSSPVSAPPADLPGTIVQAITLLQNKDIPELMQLLLAPDMWDEWKAEMLNHGQIQQMLPMMSEVRLRAMLTAGQLRQIMQKLGIPVDEKLVASYTHAGNQDQQQAQFLAELKSVANQPPIISSDGVHARYPLSVPGDRDTVIFFQKIGGKWYLQN